MYVTNQSHSVHHQDNTELFLANVRLASLFKLSLSRTNSRPHVGNAHREFTDWISKSKQRPHKCKCWLYEVELKSHLKSTNTWTSSLAEAEEYDQRHWVNLTLFCANEQRWWLVVECSRRCKINEHHRGHLKISGRSWDWRMSQNATTLRNITEGVRFLKIAEDVKSHNIIKSVRLVKPTKGVRLCYMTNCARLL